ncbi:unnamed protein product [Linum tenue]|uniref:Alpha/beta hydrolase fold-3 domain-containing protein n=1 Tax=Linum tenue TaxID=586396 RepID=A0AAV0NG36_9ROSI|nr:unnamed protein product [Linum tenue]
MKGKPANNKPGAPRRSDLDQHKNDRDVMNGSFRQSWKRSSLGQLPGSVAVRLSKSLSFEDSRRSSYGCSIDSNALQFNGGGWVSGGSDSVANVCFCRRIVKLCDVIVVAMGYRLAPDNKYPAAFEDGNITTHSEIKLANSYLYDKSMCLFTWKLFLPEEEFSLDHPASNPLVPGTGGPPLKLLRPTFTVVAEQDWMRDRAITYSEELGKVNVDAPVLEYKDAVHEFATLDMLLKMPQTKACAEDVAIWVKKFSLFRCHSFSY